MQNVYSRCAVHGNGSPTSGHECWNSLVSGAFQLPPLDDRSSCWSILKNGVDLWPANGIAAEFVPRGEVEIESECYCFGAVMPKGKFPRPRCGGWLFLSYFSLSPLHTVTVGAAVKPYEGIWK